MMRQKFLRNINSVGSTDTDLLGEFNYDLGVTYQLMLAKLRNYRTRTSYSFSTAQNTQYYPYPPGEITIEGAVITVGSVNFPLKIINSEYLWEQLNAIQIQASALPQFYYPTRDGIGVWPTPQAVYAGMIYYHYRDRNLSVDDYSTGRVTVTNNSATVTGSGTQFSNNMAGEWFSVTDTAVPGQGYWYRVLSRDSDTQLTLDNAYVGQTSSNCEFVVGQTPELPEEGHMTLVDGATALFYNDYRKDPVNGALFGNKFWTGDPNNKSRKEGDTEIAGGLIGLVNRYADRDDTRVVNRDPHLNPLQYKVWATSLS